MLARRAVEAYLNRELDDWRWMKELSSSELDHAISELETKPKFSTKTPLWKHQKVLFLLGVYLQQFLFFVDMGGGKSRVILELVRYLKRCGLEHRWLICVKDIPNVENWVMEIECYAPDLKYICLDDAETQKRLEMLNSNVDLFILHYPGLVASCSDLQEVEGSGKRRRRLNKAKVRVYQKHITAIVFDESTAVMNRSSLTFRVGNAVAKSLKYRFAMTGTPFGKDTMPLWAQFFVIDHGETLGAKLSLFRAIFFKQKPKYFGGFEYKSIKKLEPELHRVISHRSITYETKEMTSLPPRSQIRKVVILPKANEEYYKKALETLRRSRGSWAEVDNSFLRLRQISSGFIGLKNDETGAKVKVELPYNPKLDLLLGLVDEMPAGAKMVVFHEYIWTGMKISAALNDRGVKHLTLAGATKDKRGVIRKFRDDDSFRLLLTNNNLGSVGHNFQVANYSVFFESPIRPIIRQQAERRVWRPGQTKKCFEIDLIARAERESHSVDERILDALKEGYNLKQRVLLGKETL